MKYFQEVTEWADKTPNHIYYLSDDKTSMVGYIKVGSKDLYKFKNPIRIDVRGRKFKVLDMKAEPDNVYFKKEAPKKDVIIVQGSNGKEYQVEKISNKYVCSCPGFIFRHKCKHVEGLK
jgi:hypothetical protein